MTKTEMKHKAQEILTNSLTSWGATIEQLEDLQLDEKTYAEMYRELQKQTSRLLKLFRYKDNCDCGCVVCVYKPEEIKFG